MLEIFFQISYISAQNSFIYPIPERKTPGPIAKLKFYYYF